MFNFKRIAILGLSVMALSGLVTGCSMAGKGDSSTGASEVTNISDEEIVMTASLDLVTYNSGEEKLNEYYKKGTDKEGNLCYILNADGKEMYVPLDSTVVYTMESGDPYIEKVTFSYDVDGEKIGTEQYRVYVS